MRKIAVILCLLGLAISSVLSDTSIDLTPYASVSHEPLNEISGIAKSRRWDDVYWVINDRGDEARIFAIDSEGVPVLPTYSRFSYYGGEKEKGKEPWQGFRVMFAKNNDWESMTVDDRYLYVADMGNNHNRRRHLVIYMLGEIDPTASTQAAVIRKIPVRYPDQKEFPAHDKHFDSESLFAADGQLYVITKHRKRGIIGIWEPGAKLYRLDTRHTDEPNILTLIDSNPQIEAATGAELSPDGSRLAVLSYKAVWIFERPPEGDQWLSSAFTKIVLKPRQARQAEAITWEDDETLLILNEQRDMFRLTVP